MLDPLKYKPIHDHIKPDLNILFCGINPGAKSSLDGHHYAHPSNHFWPCLNASGILPANVNLMHVDDHRCPDEFNIGFTNLCSRPTRKSSHLKSAEYALGSMILFEKISVYRPKILCFEGREISRHFLKYLSQAQPNNVELYGEIKDGLIGYVRNEGGRTMIFSMPSSSARCTIKKQYKVSLFKELAKHVRKEIK